MKKSWRMALAAAFIMLAASLPTAAGGSQGHDAGTGRDAPDAWEDALDVTATRFVGAQSGPSDEHDWYRIQVPPGKSLRVTIDPLSARFVTLRALTDDGRNLSYSRNFGWDYSQSIFVPQGEPAVRIDALVHEDYTNPGYHEGSYEILVVPVEPRPQQDGGYADDASDDRDAALETPYGTLRGELRPSQGDREDWYRIPVPVGTQVRAVLRLGEGDASLTGADDGGWPKDVSDASGLGGIEIVNVADRHSGGVRIGVRHVAGEGNYTLELQQHKLADLEPAEIRVSEETSPIPQTSRTVTITVTNNGGPADNVHVKAWVAFSAYAADHFLGSTVVSIWENASAEVPFEWDTRGQAGTARVYACVSNSVDVTFTDNLQSQETHVLAPLPGGMGLHPAGYVPWGQGLEPLPWREYYGYCLTWDPWTLSA